MSITPGRPHCTVCMDEEPITVTGYRPGRRRLLDAEGSHQPGGVITTLIEPSVTYSCARSCLHDGEVSVSDDYLPPPGTPRL